MQQASKFKKIPTLHLFIVSATRVCHSTFQVLINILLFSMLNPKTIRIGAICNDTEIMYGVLL